MRKFLVLPALVALTLSSVAPAMAQKAEADKSASAFEKAGDDIGKGFKQGYKATEKKTKHIAKKTGEYADNAGTKTKRFFTEKPDPKETVKEKADKVEEKVDSE